jgi:hypothetical protein
MELLGVLHLLAYEHGTAVSTMAATVLQRLHISSSTAYIHTTTVLFKQHSTA